MDEKDKIIAEQGQLIQKLEMRISELEALLLDLKARLNKNSSNSHKPPSQDIYIKNSSLREPSGKKSGGQKGRKGSGIKSMPADQTVEMPEENTCACGADLSNITGEIESYKVVDTPKIQALVTKYEHHIKTCPHCKKRQTLPKTKNTLSYGENIKSYVIYLSQTHFLPSHRLREVLKAMLGFAPSEGIIYRWIKQLSASSKPIIDQIQARLISSEEKVKHIDETGIRVNKKTSYAHVLSNKNATVYEVAKRGQAKWMSSLQGFVVSDCFSANLAQKHEKVLCNQHIMRELKALMPNDKQATKIYQALKALYVANKQSRKSKLIQRLKTNFIKKVEVGLNEQVRLPHYSLEAGGKRKRRPAHNLYERLLKYESEFLRFLEDPDIPFTNNQAEQDLRMIKVKQKVSGCFRSHDGAHCFANIFSLVSTARKLSIHVLDAIKNPQMVLHALGGCE